MRAVFRLGPATLVTAAFIGPGTVVTASMAGANYGFALLWALLFAVVATLILQEMAARLGIVTGQGLGENLRQQLQHPILKVLVFSLVIAAIVVGNSAYQGGNLTGASLGAEAIWGQAAWRQYLTSTTSLNPWALLLGIVASAILWQGRYALIERWLIGLVLLMSLAFVSTMLLTKPNLPAILGGVLIPTLPAGSTLTIIALIGTTVVPYSLFLHAASAAKKWQQHRHEDALQQSAADLRTAIPLGGLVTLAIVSTAATAFFGQSLSLSHPGELPLSLEPLFGSSARYLMALGLLAAGLSSALTAPLAAAYALKGLLDLNANHFRLTWFVIMLVGVIVSSLGLKPLNIIWFAQIANGVLLPIITLCLLLAVNQRRLGPYQNSLRQNVLGVAVLAVTLLLSGRTLYLALS